LNILTGMQRTVPRRQEATSAEQVFPASTDMGRLCREHDWAATPLGPVDEWPQSLKTAAGMVVRQGIAQSICWGPELLQIYNDAYRVILGDKHPAALGRPVLWTWAEIERDIRPLFERVMGGETVYFEDLRLEVVRFGEKQKAFFTFSYSPVIGEEGTVAGVLVNCFETTDQVRARSVQRDRDRLLAELELERARLASVFEDAPAFLAVLHGPQHVFALANAEYQVLVGHRELIGRPIREAVPEAAEQGFAELLDGVFATGKSYVGREASVRVVRAAGEPAEERFVDFVYAPLVEADGSVTGVIVHGTDVTAHVLARREAESARKEAELANRAKGDFLAAMSHELRTPLNAIAGYVELLQLGIHGDLTDEQRTSLARVRANQQHLLRLINDVLAFAKVEAGQLELDLTSFDAAELLDTILPLVAPQAAAKRIDFGVDECPPGLMAVGDLERVRQILLNLVGNAIKFTPPGGRVTLSCHPAGSCVTFRVRDNGPGIAIDQQQSIFDPFVQVERRLSNPREGVGLGLAISADLARAMDGSITVESTLGEGSTFTLELPSAAPA
jgi:PAS domain S-box-containing protein